MSQPAGNLPDWDSSLTNIAEPSGGLKASGWATNAIPTSTNLNWILWKISQWLTYLKNLNGEAFSWSAAHAFGAAVTMATTLVVTGATTLSSTLVVTLATTLNGLATLTAGLVVTRSTAGAGTTTTGNGSGAGVVATGGATGRGGTFAAGGGNTAGVHSTGSGTGAGVHAVSGTGGSAVAMRADASGGTNSAGLWATGQGNGESILADGCVDALLCAGGNATTTSAHTNSLGAANIPKAWGTVTCVAGVITLVDGFNVASVAVTGGSGGLSLDVTLAAAMADTNYCIGVTSRQSSGHGHALGAVPASTTVFNVGGYTTADAQINFSAITSSFNFIVFGKQ